MLIQLRAPKLVVGLLLGALIFGVGAGLGAYLTDHQPSQTATNASDQETKQRGGQEWLGLTSDQWVAVATLALFGATFALFVVTSTGIRNQARDTRILQRAYLSVAPGGIEPFTGRTTIDSNAVVKIRNDGNLPATRVRWGIETTIEIDDRWRPPPAEHLPLEGDNVLPARAEMLQGSYAFPAQPSGDLATFRTKYIYVWGRVLYRDGFGKPSWIDFCHRYNCGNITEETIARDGGYRIAAEKGRYNRYGNNAG